MADARRIRHCRRETIALSYGHLGTAIYDEGRHEWTFLRRHQTKKNLGRDEGHPLEHDFQYFQLVHESSLDLSAKASNGKTATLRHPANGGGLKNLFLKNVPDSAYVITDLPASKYNSESQEEIPAQNQPMASALALGYARSPYEVGMYNDVPNTTIVALPASPHKEVLQLLSFEACHSEIRSSAGLDDSFTLPCVTRRVVGYWCESSDEILQVSSANPANGTKFLVVKPSGTTILRPMSTKTTLEVPLRSSSSSVFTPAELRLDPGPIITIPLSRTGGNPHVHAAFNPEDPSLLAIVDSTGEWSVWKITGRMTKSTRILYQLHLQGANNLIVTDKQSAFRTNTLPGGDWHRICWLRSSRNIMDRILVCSRRSAAVFDQSGESLGQLDMRLGLPADGNLILDIKNTNFRRDCDHRPNHLFVLTTSRVMIFSSGEGDRRERDPTKPLDLMCSWGHGRDRADLGLRMSLLESSRDSWVLVYSTTGLFAVIYRFGYQSSQPSVVSLQDPSTFQLPQQLRDRIDDIMDIVLRPVDFSIQDEPAKAVDYGLVKLIACTNGGQLIEALYKHDLPQLGLAMCRPKDIPVLSLPETLKSRSRSAQYIVDDDLEDFVVTSATEADCVTKHVLTRRSAANVIKPTTMAMRNWHCLLDYLPVEGNVGSTGGEVVQFSTSLEQAVEHFERLQSRNDPISVQLISDLVDNCPVVDLEEDSGSSESWLHGLAMRADMSIESVAGVPTLPQCSDQQVLDYYSYLVDTFVHSLSDQLTDRNRVNRERLVRQIVGPLVFGTFMLKTRTDPPDSAQIKPEPDPISTIPLPSSGPDLDDQGFSQISTPESSVPSEEPAVARLRHYTAFIHQVPPLLLDRNTATSNILGHLPVSIEEEPADYSYQQTNQSIRLLQEQVATESLDPKQRKKALKSAARLQRKVERNQQMSQEIMLQRMLLPGISAGTGLANVPGREVQSSQGAAPGSSRITDQNAVPGLTMTQPQRGTFGARQTFKKGKKRRAGF